MEDREFGALGAGSVLPRGREPGEDRHAPENLATMRHAALNLFRQDRHSKLSIEVKRKLAACDNDYLLAIRGKLGLLRTMSR